MIPQRSHRRRTSRSSRGVRRTAQSCSAFVTLQINYHPSHMTPPPPPFPLFSLHLLHTHTHTKQSCLKHSVGHFWKNTVSSSSRSFSLFSPLPFPRSSRLRVSHATGHSCNKGGTLPASVLRLEQSNVALRCQISQSFLQDAGEAGEKKKIFVRQEVILCKHLKTFL